MAGPMLNAPAGEFFDQRLAADVFSTALVFMAPRILDPVSISRMAIWGLRGLSALDPLLTCDLRNGALVLAANDHVLMSLAAPGDEDPPGWAAAVASLASSAFSASPSLRRAGTSGIIRSFFDELFNHLDPYSRYAPPAEAEDNRDRRSGTSGLGITAGLRGGALVVDRVANDSPAARAGIKPGDRLLAVDGAKLTARDATRIDRLMSGAEGSAVSLTIRASDGHIAALTMQRALVPPESVFAIRVGDMLVLRIASFTRDTDRRVAEELAHGLVAAPAPHGVVFDLRGNRGGLLRQAVMTAALLLDGGVIATTAGRDPDAAHLWRAEGSDLANGLPVVVAVDGRSASAAEIVTAALADDRRAVVVGSSTLGKGLVQTITALPDGGELLLTWSRVLAPLGWPIQGLGVLPQVCTSLGYDALSRQLDALNQGEQPMQSALLRHRTARAPMPIAQILDIRNACPAAVGRDTDMEAAHYLIETPKAYAAALLK